MTSEGNSESVEKFDRELRSIRRYCIKRLINELKTTEELITYECFHGKTGEFEDLITRFKETPVSLLRSLSVDTTGNEEAI